MEQEMVEMLNSSESLEFIEATNSDTSIIETVNANDIKPHNTIHSVSPRNEIPLNNTPSTIKQQHTRESSIVITQQLEPIISNYNASSHYRRNERRLVQCTDEDCPYYDHDSLPPYAILPDLHENMMDHIQKFHPKG